VLCKYEISKVSTGIPSKEKVCKKVSHIFPAVMLMLQANKVTKNSQLEIEIIRKLRTQ